MSAKETLNSYICDRANNITNDCLTFLFYKCTYNQDYHLHGKSINLGGGNLTMGIGLFSVIEYLSKIYYVLKVGWFNIPADHKKGNDLKGNEAFWVLINDLPVDLGIKTLNKSEMNEFWKNWRHKLVHLLAQDSDWGTVKAYDLPLCITEMEKKVSENQSFKKIDNVWHCNADKLRQDCQSITQWVSSQLDTYEQNIQTTLEWLESQWD